MPNFDAIINFLAIVLSECENMGRGFEAGREVAVGSHDQTDLCSDLSPCHRVTDGRCCRARTNGRLRSIGGDAQRLSGYMVHQQQHPQGRLGRL